MAKRKAKKNAPPRILSLRLQQTTLVIYACLGVYFLLILSSYSLIDPTFLHTAKIIHNQGGLVGAWCADILFSLLGLGAYALPLSLFYYTYIHWMELHIEEDEPSRLLSILRFMGWLLILIALSGLFTLILDRSSWPYLDGPGGVVGFIAPNFLVPLFNLTGSLLIEIMLFCLGLTLFSGKIWLKHFKTIALLLAQFFKNTVGFVVSLFYFKAPADHTPEPLPPAVELPPEPEETRVVELPKILPKKEITSRPVIKAKPPARVPTTGEIPTVDLLDEPDENRTKIKKEALTQMATLVEQKLLDFGIQASVAGICPGPVITRYEIQLAPGVKAARLVSIDRDLARSLSVSSVRIVEVIPGKAYVGIELPNNKREMVRLREVLDSEKFRESKSPVAMGLGKDIGGVPEVVDLAKMPHLLVAGTTGSGKSVGINAMILSMILKSKPEELRLIMIDPKMLELSIYEGIPHLLTPVVTDMKEAANALRWSVKEMDRRYRLMAALGVRNISGFNDAVNAAIKKGSPIKDPLWLQLNPGRANECPQLEPLPYIVVIVDEFADMMMVVGKKVEELITRIAQKARAAGIHLILATQRPSVDVITGLIKANIPTRISFQVSSRIDSRTILDQQGAEQLLGHGDMLYLPAGSGHPIRVHGAYVSDQEVHRVVEAWKACGAPQYLDGVVATDKLEGEESDGNGEGAPEGDALYDEAVKIVLESKRASISLVQRRLRIGYNRAARLLEDMEKAGLVSAIQSNGMREILVEAH
jgi:S-DNA-T family DNA segregation ATPase FtsK/SpoIIIE